MLSVSEENYLKAIYSIISKTENWAATNDIATKLKTKASSVTDMITRLHQKELVKHKKYKGVYLTSKGKLVALQTIRKHRLWEVFLVQKLNFKWDEVHIIAEQLEHIKSPELINRMDEFLGNPRFDPHGDPIPDKDGNLPQRDNMINLSELNEYENAIVIGIHDSSDEFLKYLDDLGLILGEQIFLTKIYEYDQSRKIKIGKTELHLSKQVCDNVKVIKK